MFGKDVLHASNNVLHLALRELDWLATALENSTVSFKLGHFGELLRVNGLQLGRRGSGTSGDSDWNGDT